MKKNYVLVAAGLGLVQLVLLSTTARAQDTSRVLNDVVVTATRSPKKLSEIGRVVTVISSEDISRAQGKTLPQLLNSIPGITFSGANNAPGISSDVYVRGASPGNTLILIDDFPVNNASAIDGNYDLNAFPLDQIDHIEILKGTGSTLYGSDAVAGVINIITRHDRGKGLKSNVQLSGGSYNTFKESAGITGNIENTGLAINLSNTDSRGFPAATDTIGRAGYKNDGFHQRSASVNLDHRLTDKFILNANLQTSYNTGNLPLAAFMDDKNYTYKNTFLFAGIGGKLLLPNGALVINLSQNDVWNKYSDLPSTLNNSTLQVDNYTGKITNAEMVFNYGLGKHFDITSGANYKYSTTDQYSLYTSVAYPSPANAISSDTAHSSIISAYSSLFYKSKIFHMELGGRFNHDSRYGNRFTYTVNPSLLIANSFKIFATVASAYKSPSLYQLFSPYGTPDLKPETTTSYEVGFDWQLIDKTLSFSTAFYKYSTNGVIYFESEATAPFGKYLNGELQRNKGFESELKYIRKNFTATAYAAYVTGTLLLQNGTLSNTLNRRPKNTYGATAYYQFQRGISMGLVYRYVGDRSDENYLTGQTIALKHYNLLDGHLQYDANKHISLFADLKNLLDVKYTDWLGYNTARFNFMAGIKYQIN